MQIGNWQFRPRLLPSVMTVILLPVLILLGFWQIDRAQQKRDLYQLFIQHQQAPPVILNNEKKLHMNKADMLWRHVITEGEFRTDTIILLDNQVVNAIPGYLVFMPFKLAGEDLWILVNRGWIDAGSDRNRIPKFRSPHNTVTITGVAKDVPATGLVLGDTVIENLQNGLYRCQRINLAEISELINLELLPYIIRLEPESDHGFTRHWTPPGSGEEIHLGYAFQWFALSLTLVIIYLVVNIKKAG